MVIYPDLSSLALQTVTLSSTYPVNPLISFDSTPLWSYKIQRRQKAFTSVLLLKDRVQQDSWQLWRDSPNVWSESYCATRRRRHYFLIISGNKFGIASSCCFFITHVEKLHSFIQLVESVRRVNLDQWGVTQTVELFHALCKIKFYVTFWLFFQRSG